MINEPNNSTAQPRDAGAEQVVGRPADGGAAPEERGQQRPASDGDGSGEVQDEAAARAGQFDAGQAGEQGGRDNVETGGAESNGVELSGAESSGVESSRLDSNGTSGGPDVGGQIEESDTGRPIEEAIDEAGEAEAAARMDWYILKVQSNREESIREALERRIAIAGLQRYFDEIIVPTEMVSEFKNGKKRVVKRKLYPGYIVVHMELNDDTWFLVRETPGIGDFTGSGGKPSPMLPHEVSRIVAKQEEKADEAPKLKISFSRGDRVKITEGTFENFEGDVESIDEANGRVTVMINIFGRSTPVELEYWQIESL